MPGKNLYKAAVAPMSTTNAPALAKPATKPGKMAGKKTPAKKKPARGSKR